MNVKLIAIKALTTGVFVLFSLPPLQAQVDTGATYDTEDHGKQVIGYVPEWDGWKNTDAGYPVAAILNQLNLDYSQYTILNFSFFGVAKDGSLHSGDWRNQNIWQEGAVQEPNELLRSGLYDSFDYWLLFGEVDLLSSITSAATAAGYQACPDTDRDWEHPASGTKGKFPLPLRKSGGRKGLLDLCHENSVKCMASIGGWSMCKHFPATAADPAMRARFIAGCKELVDLGFDGIDLDWEYPGPFSGMNFTGSEADYANFTTLVAELREAIGEDKLITAAISAVPAKTVNLEWKKLDALMDYFNIMSYDFHGGWSDKAGHNSPLFPYPDEDIAPYSWHTSLESLLASGVNPAKINMGIAFYGRSVVTNGMGAVNAPTIKRNETIQPDGPIVTAADYTNFPTNTFAGTPFYPRILEKTGAWTEAWDENAMVPYRYTNGFFISYDNPRSVALKGKYVRDNGLAGVIVWEAFADLIPGAVDSPHPKLPKSTTTRAPLINAVNASLAGAPVPGETSATAFLSIGPVAKTEGDSGTDVMQFPVTLSAPTDGPVTVHYATADGTATAGSDYEAVDSSLSFAPGETKKTIYVPVHGDTDIEPNETFTVTLSQANGAHLPAGAASATGVILDDDADSFSVWLSITDTSLEEGNIGTKTATLAVTLSEASTDPVSVEWATVPGTAEEGSDFVAASGTLQFSPGETEKTVEVQIVSDIGIEPDETFTVVLSNATGAGILRDTGIVTIVNDDLPEQPGWVRHYVTGSHDFEVVGVEPSAVWGTGFSGMIHVTNNSGEDIENWKLEFDAPWTTTGSGGAGSWTVTGDHHVVTNPTWGGYNFPAGSTINLDFTGSGTWSQPTNIVFNGQPIGTPPDNVPLHDWMASHGVTDVHGDSNHNGVPDLIDFLTGTDMDAQGSSPSVISASVRMLNVEEHQGRYFCVELDANANAQGVEYRIETSGDMVHWHGGTHTMVVHQTTEGPDGRIHVLWRTPMPMPPGAGSVCARLAARVVDEDTGK